MSSSSGFERDAKHEAHILSVAVLPPEACAKRSEGPDGLVAVVAGAASIVAAAAGAL
jgi:hypothetical protein